MRKYLLFALLLCIQWSAHGQTSYDYRYWFDMDEGNQHTGTSSTGSWNIETDLSGLDCSLHAIHIQVKDTSGVWSAPKTRYFMKMPNRTLAGGNYWFDNDFLSRQPLATVNGKFDVDVSSMSETLHYIHFQANDAAGYVSSPFTSLFMKLPIEKSLSYRYWIDNDQTTMKSGKLTGESMMFDVSDLTDGFHVITLQVDGNGGSSIPANRMFIKIPQTEGVSELTCMCSIDDRVYKQEKVAPSGGVVDWQFDVSTLEQGLHRIQVQVFTPSGAATNIYNGFFFRIPMDGELQNMNLVYSIDGGDHKSIKGSYNNGMFHFDMDVASIEDGLHNMTYMLASETGTSTKVNTAFFMKTPVGGPGIISYKYWLNDYEDETRDVKLEERKNPYDLITLLPVDTCPIRSSCFHFEIQYDGIPMVYAKNDIHFQFYDVSNRVAEAHKQYVDYNVGETITDLTLLESGKCNIEKPTENEVKWFKIEACEGDTIAFRSDQATSIQVFSPTGKEIYNVSGYESTNWSGCHTWEDGLHYVAVHDVQGIQTNVTLEYMHMDKHDVVDQDVKVVGNGGCSTITFKGNGFRDLYAVDFVTGGGDTISSKAINYESDAIVNITFDFTDRKKGKYDALFHFTTEIKEFDNNIVVEEAKQILLDLDVRYPNSFLLGSSVTYTVSVTNNGNSTAYDVPLELKLQAGNSFDNIESIVFTDSEGNEFNNLTLDEIDTDSMDQETIFIIENELKRYNGLQNFIVKRDSVEKKEYGFLDMYLTIQPSERSVFYITLKSKSSVTLEARIPSEWITVNTRNNAGYNSNSKSHAPSDNGLCCYKEAAECLMDVTVAMVGFLPVSGCIDILSFYAYTTIEIACNEGNSLMDKANDFFASTAEGNKNHESYRQKGISAIISCVTGKLFDKLVKPIVERLKILKKELDGLDYKLRDTQRDKKFFLKELENAKVKHQEFATQYNKNLEDAVVALNNGDYVAAKELYDKAEKAKNEMLKYKQMQNEYSERISSLDDLINSYQTDIDKILDEIKKGRLEEIAKKEELREILDNIRNSINVFKDVRECRKTWDETIPDCPKYPQYDGGSSSPVTSWDPNDIKGYRAESGSKAVKKDQKELYYTIEFENDTAFATASAQDVYLTDTLDGRYLDLESFAPTGLKIGDKKVELDGKPNFVTTVDMRPSINAIAQVECNYDSKTGIAKWHFSSLDPMTMEPVENPMDGFLPINNSDGDGMGEVSFNINLKDDFEDGTEIKNRASIVFDYNDAIITPTWTNIIDATAPISRAADIEHSSDSTAVLSIEATDELSGMWRYDVYVQYGSGAWFLAAENVPADTTATVKIYEGIDHGFYVVATDSAGNVEQKEPMRELSYNLTSVVKGDVNGDGRISIVDITMVTNAVLKKEDENFNAEAADMNLDGRVSIVDATMITNIILKK